MFKGTKLYSIFGMKCPKCHQGDIFQDPNPYHFSNLFKINESCDHCGQKYEPEPNFYYGSMYVSYAYSVAIIVASWVIGKFVFDLSLLNIFFVIVGAMLVLTPYLFRLSRVTWLNFFIRYDASALSKGKATETDESDNA